ncbi:MAG: DNA translocase FtsK 4TM domain-containing protein [Planctomycetia bacterium]|nr:DNA translocase FtsK 4TM domain-containing protein [Planctomycetia bacterium]
MKTGKLFFGLLLLAILIFISISLFSYCPTDKPNGLIFPPTEQFQNYCGFPGAYFSAWLLGLLGYAGFLVPFFGALSLIFYWKKDGLSHPVLRTVGMVFILSGLAGLSSFLLNQNSLGPLIGSGGYWGTLLHYYLSHFFVPVGCLIFLISLFIAGTILIGDFILLRYFFFISGIYECSEIILNLIKQFYKRPKNRKKPHKPTDSEISTQTSALDSTVKLNPNDYAYSDQLSKKAKSYSLSDNPEHLGYVDCFDGSDSTDSKHFHSNDFPEQPDRFVNQLGENHSTSFETDSNHFLSNKNESDGKSTSNKSLTQLTKTEEYPKREYHYPPIDLLKEKEEYDHTVLDEKTLARAIQLEKAFKSYKMDVQVVDTQTGPVLTLFEIILSEGLRVKNIHALTRDLEIAMKVPSVRIVSPIPGKGTVGVELPNMDRQLVRLREVMEEGVEESNQMEIPIFLGKDVIGDPMVTDLAKLPHLLIAGRTGTGKSVCLNSIIMSILMTRRPDEVRLIMIDPKMVELSPYKTIPHLMHPVVIDMKKAEAILEWAVEKMEQRYLLLAQAGVNQITKYNKLTPDELRNRMKPQTEEEWAAIPKSMPYIVLIADEMADLVMTAGKEVERHIIRLAQKSRAVGIHLVLATQKPTVDVITGLIKSNLPARIAFGVATRTDSQVVLDCKGAEQLLGNGDMLFLKPGSSQVIRGQGTFVSDKEIESVISTIGLDESEMISEIDLLNDEDEDDDVNDLIQMKKDEYYEAAVETVFQKGKASISYIQRKFSVGYNRAAKMIEMMEQEGIVSPVDRFKPSKPRDLIISYQEWQNRQNESGSDLSNLSLQNNNSQNRFRPSQQTYSQSNNQSYLNQNSPNNDLNHFGSNRVKQSGNGDDLDDFDSQNNDNNFNDIDNDIDNLNHRNQPQNSVNSNSQILFHSKPMFSRNAKSNQEQFENDDYRYNNEQELDSFFDEYEDDLIDEYEDYNNNSDYRNKKRQKGKNSFSSQNRNDLNDQQQKGWSDEQWEQYYDSWDKQQKEKQFQSEQSDNSSFYDMRTKAQERRDRKRNKRKNRS